MSNKLLRSSFETGRHFKCGAQGTIHMAFHIYLSFYFQRLCKLGYHLWGAEEFGKHITTHYITQILLFYPMVKVLTIST